MQKIRNKIILFLSMIIGIVICIYTYQQYNSTKKYKAIIFDMDGTIIDTDHLWKLGNAPILDSHAPHLTDDEKNSIKEQFNTMTIYEVWQCVHGHCSIHISSEELINENIKHLHILYQNQGITFIPHFENFHKNISDLGLKSAIATNSQEETVKIITQVTPLTQYFNEHIYHADHVNKAFKPKPDIYLHAAKMLNVKPCECIVIEDSASGIKAAKSAGMYCIGINTGKNRNNLLQADEIVDCYTEIDVQKLLK